MAQHYDERAFRDHKAVQKVFESIKKQKYFKTSMRFQEVAKNIYTTERFVGRGVVWGSNRATFEVHTDDRGAIKNIFLVA